MRNRSLQTQLNAIFLGFLLLVFSSAATTFWLAQTQQQDAALINLVGRQRMLEQQMARLALTAPEDPELVQTIGRFEQTLAALTGGGRWWQATAVPSPFQPRPTHLFRPG